MELTLLGTGAPSGSASAAFLSIKRGSALSPQRQIALLALIGDAVASDAQFLIATHSPMLMAWPGAQLLSLDDDGFREIAWDQTAHVQITRDFLNDPDLYLRIVDRRPGGIVVPPILLRAVVQPRPLVLAVAEPAARGGPRPGLTQGEKGSHFFRHVLWIG